MVLEEKYTSYFMYGKRKLLQPTHSFHLLISKKVFIFFKCKITNDHILTILCHSVTKLSVKLIVTLNAKELTVSVVHATVFLSSSFFLSLNLRVGVDEGSPLTSSASTTIVPDPADWVARAQAPKIGFNIIVNCLLRPLC